MEQEDKKVLEVVAIYRKYFQASLIPEKKYPHDKSALFGDDYDKMSHCHSMLKGIEEFIASGDTKKVKRAHKRFGFVEGCLWATGHYTVNRLKEQSKPDTDPDDTGKTLEPLTREELTEDWEYGEY